MSNQVNQHVPFNEVEGIASTNVPAYSNKKPHYSGGGPHFLHGVFTGYQWQCVEFARRWLLMRKTCIFRDIPCAYHIWTHVSYVERITDGQCFQLTAVPNGSLRPPRKESLLIYGPNRKMPYGHVAIITDVTDDHVHIAEQNNLYTYWPGDYARKERLIFRDGRYHIEDEDPIYGWMEIDENHLLEPLDEFKVKNILQKYIASGDNDSDND